MSKTSRFAKVMDALAGDIQSVFSKENPLFLHVDNLVLFTCILGNGKLFRNKNKKVDEVVVNRFAAFKEVVEFNYPNLIVLHYDIMAPLSLTHYTDFASLRDVVDLHVLDFTQEHINNYFTVVVNRDRLGDIVGKAIPHLTAEMVKAVRLDASNSEAFDLAVEVWPVKKPKK